MPRLIRLILSLSILISPLSSYSTVPVIQAPTIDILNITDPNKNVIDCPLPAKDYIGGDCGPKVLKKILEVVNQEASIKELIDKTSTVQGETHLEGLRKGAVSYGLKAIGVKTDFSSLIKILKKDFFFVAHFGGNRHYILINEINDKWVKGYNPAVSQPDWSLPRSMFEKTWKGEGLLLWQEKIKSKAVKSPKKKKFSKEIRLLVSLLSEERMLRIWGGSGCANCNGFGGGGSGWGWSTYEPVELSNGNYYLETDDFIIPSLGPDLKVEKTYNAQVFSDVPGWQPDEGTGGWSVENGVFSGAGDRTLSEGTWENVRATMSMQTIEHGSSFDHEVARVNFRYQDVDNRYYFFMKTNGLLELTRISSGTPTYLASVPSSYSPTDAHTVSVEAQGANIKVWVDSNLEIDIMDSDPLTGPGRVVLESYFSHSHYDDILITDLDTSISYFWDFSFDDNDGMFGRGWRSNIEMNIVPLGSGDLRVRRGNDRRDYFTFNASSNVWTSPNGFYETIAPNGTGYDLIQKDKTIFHFNTLGRLENVKDRNNNTLTFSYATVNGKERINLMIDATGRSLSFSYDVNGHCTLVTDPLGRTRAYAYDTNGQLASETDPRGKTKQFQYDQHFRMTNYINRRGLSFQNTYAYNNRTLTQTDPEGNVTTFDYLWNITQVTDSNGKTRTYEFEMIDGVKSYLTQETDPEGNTTFYDWSSEHKLRSRTDPKGNLTRFDYDDNDNKLSQQDANEDVENWTYDPVYNQVTSYLDKNGNLTEYTYDANGNLLQIKNPLGHTETLTYNTQGLLLSRTGNKGNVTSFQYDAYGHLKQTTDALGNVTLQTVDLGGRVTEVINALGNATQIQYDENNSMTSSTDPLGHSMSHLYNDNDNLVQTTDPLGNVISVSYNSFDKIETATDPLGRKIQNYYDGARFMLDGELDLTGSVDPAGSTTTFTSDGRGLQTQVIDTLGNTTQYSYDDNGNLLTITDAKGNTTQYEYDSLNRTAKATYSDGSFESLEFDANDNLTKKILRNGNDISYSYNTRNEKIREFADGSLFLDGRVVGGQSTWSPNVSVEDFRLDLNMQTLVPGDEDYRTSMIHFRHQDANNRYYFLMKTTGVLELTKFKDGIQSFLLMEPSSFSPLDPHDIRLEMLGDRIQVWIDGQLSINYTDADPLLNAGGILLESPVSRSRFDDFELADIKSPAFYAKTNVITYTRDGNNDVFETVTDDQGQQISYQQVLDPAQWNVAQEQAYENFQLITDMQTLAVGQQPWHTARINFRYQDVNNYYYFILSSSGTVELNKVQSGQMSFLANQSTAYDPLDNHRVQIQAQGDLIQVWINEDLVVDYTDPTPLLGAGQIQLENHIAESRFANIQAVNLGLISKDVDITVNTKTITPGVEDYQTAWIQFRYQDIDNRYYTFLKTDGKLELTKVKEGEQSFLVSKQTSYDPLNAYDFHVKTQGERIQVWVDGKLEVDYLDTDPLVGPGAVRLLAENSQAYYEIKSFRPLFQEDWDENKSYEYDPNGNLVKTIRNGIEIWTNAYDALNRLTQSTDSHGRTLQYQYDALSRRTRLIYPDGVTIDYEYDGNDRVTKIKEGVNTLVSYSYDALGRRAAQTLGNGVSTDYTYDVASQLTDLTTNGVGSYGYTYDVLGNRTQKTAPDGIHDYTYDALSQLTQALEPAGNSDYVYDEVHNRLEVTDTTGTETAAVNNLNQITQKQKGTDATLVDWDLNGNIERQVASSTTTYVHDTYNRLERLEISDGKFLSMAYDFQGRRSSKTLGGSTEFYTWDGDQLVEVRDEQGTVLKRFIYGVGIDEPVLMRTGIGDYYYTQDGLGSVTEITDGNGNVVESYRYDAWGHLTVLDDQGQTITTSSIGNPYTFTGREYDFESGIYYYRARYYDPRLGRFLQVDPLGYEDGLNIYAYVGNNPALMVDPSGTYGGRDVSAESMRLASKARMAREKVRATFREYREKYTRARMRRVDLQNDPNFSGHQNSEKRHYQLSYEMTLSTRQPNLTRIAGVVNELQGLIRWDIPNLFSRITGESPWAFSIDDIWANEAGIQSALRQIEGVKRYCR